MIDSFTVVSNYQKRHTTPIKTILQFNQQTHSVIITTRSTTATTIQQVVHHQQQQNRRTGQENTFLNLSSSSSSSNNQPSSSSSTTKIEFSRTIQPDRVLRRRSSSSSSSNNNSNEYNINIEASDDECIALAKRFDLPQIRQLQASLTIQSYSTTDRRSSTTTNNNDIEVQGIVAATVTQRCVRTNEPFETTIEFPLYCIVRPAIPVMGVVKLDFDSIINNDNTDYYQQQQQQKTTTKGTTSSKKDTSTNKGKKTKRQKNDVSSSSYRNTIIDDMDVLQLQRLLQQNINNEDDAIMEDEFIYSTGGQLDIGELVSQLFWLELDPYPKKPGTGPIQTSITG